MVTRPTKVKKLHVDWLCLCVQLERKKLIYSNTGIAGIELRSTDGFIFPGSRAQVLAHLLSAVALISPAA